MFSSFFSVSWEKELDSSNSCKRRQSEPPLPGNSFQPRDESYVKALSKFNEWRQRQIGGTVRLSRKQSKKLLERKGQSEQFFVKRYTTNDEIALQSKNHTAFDSGLYEEIQVNRLEQNSTKTRTPPPRENTYQKAPIHLSLEPPSDISTPNRRHTNSSLNRQNETLVYENVIAELIDQFDRSPDILNISKNFLSPPNKFFKDNSNPFANVITPIKENQQQEIEKHTDDWAYESPRNVKSLDSFRANFKPFDAGDGARVSISSDRKSNRNPSYQTVINKHGDEVEYALPLNEKFNDEEERDHPESECRVVALNSTSGYQQYVDDNFQFLNENDRLGLSRGSLSFSTSQFQRGNVPVTDLDGTNATKVTEDQNNSKDRGIIQELELLEAWSQNISKTKENSLARKIATDMHFGEIIVCNTNEVSEQKPRQLFETLNGTFHAGTFHCVPVSQFKPKESVFSDSILQFNYEILRKIRHPDIVLLMGITVDNKCALDSLILEPIDYSLHHFIHMEGGCISTSVCLLYTIQINNAVTYLHKHGLVHSNVSTHSVVMCHLSKAVKLTSFELTTTLSGDLTNELVNFFQDGQYENLNAYNAADLPPKLRPYNVEYRKMFTRHNYQAPELLSNGIPFVFPKVQSDVYGICLMLWEMINCSMPFTDFDYDEMAKLIYLQNAQLPVLREERQTPFQKILQLGLNMLTEKRISDTNELKEALNEVSFNLDDKIDASNKVENPMLRKHFSEGISSLLCNKGFGPTISERTSTIKKRKNVFGGNRLAARQLFTYSQINKSTETSDAIVHSQISSPNSPQYGFEIGEVSIPETPIARSNKLRKTAWLSNQSISPIVHLEIKSNDHDSAVNQIQIVENNLYNALSSEETSSNKLYNVNIRIRPTPKNAKTPMKTEDMSEQSPQSFTNLCPQQKNTSQISNYIKFFNLVSKQSPHQLIHSPTKTQSPVENILNYNTSLSKPASVTEKIINQTPAQTTTAVDQNSINEFFNRSHQTADFENSLWRREKQKCDQSVKSQRRISVKDAVNKFESFSKSLSSDSNSPKLKKTLQPSSTYRLDEIYNEKSNVVCSKNDSFSEKNVSTLNIVLENKSDDSCCHEKDKESVQIIEPEADSVCFETKESHQSPMLTLNFKKLDRRASDLGSYFIRQNSTTNTLTARHSINGSDILKRLRKAKLTSENMNEDVAENNGSKPLLNKNSFHERCKDLKIKVGKLTCMNCGHKLFVVDDIVHSNSGEDLNDAYSELFLTPLKRNLGLQQVSKSTEDFYIDDDFCEDFELCANMELGTRTQLSDIIDFDIFSAEIFNAADEEATHV